MQIGSSKDVLSPLVRGSMSDQLVRQWLRHQRVFLLRTVQFWWFPILLVALGGLLAAILAQYVTDYPLLVFGGLCALPFVVVAIRRLEFGLLVVAIIAMPFSPLTFSLKSLEIDPPVLLLLVLYGVFVIQAAFRTGGERVLPSFWVLWPLFGLLLLALVSNLFVQISWTSAVPHKLNGSPLLNDEIYGVSLFIFPLLVTTVTTVSMTGKERWIEIIGNAYLIAAVVTALVVIIDFRRIGADVYAFRYAEPTIGWMGLRAIAQILSLGVIIAYVNFLFAKDWRMRITFGVSMLMCLASVYFTLENSWWLEVAAALLVTTIVYSRRLFLFFCLISLPLLPFLKGELTKLQSAKSVDFYRLIIWNDSLRVWSKQPVLGVGPGNFWSYDQVFTALPRYLRNFNQTGLGVAHNGYLQMLGEMGPLGLFFMLAFIVVMITAASRLYRRSNTEETRRDRILALICLGLVCGSTVADFVSGSFFLQPRQIGSAKVLPQLMSTWIIYGFVMYKDQVRRMARRGIMKCAAGLDDGKVIEGNPVSAVGLVDGRNKSKEVMP